MISMVHNLSIIWAYFILYLASQTRRSGSDLCYWLNDSSFSDFTYATLVSEDTDNPDDPDDPEDPEDPEDLDESDLAIKVVQWK